MEIKDIIPPIILIATIISSHWLASKQTRKTKRAKWIEDFRFEIAKFIALSNLVNPKDIMSIQNVATSGYVILMLLDDERKKHKLLNDEIVTFQIFGLDYKFTEVREYEDRIRKIKDLAKAIIKEEEKKL